MKGLLVLVAAVCIVSLGHAASVPGTQEEVPTSTVTGALNPPNPATATVRSTETENQVLLEFTVYRVHGNISGRSWAGDAVLVEEKGEGRPPAAPPEHKPTVFTFAELIVAGEGLRANEKGWTWYVVESPEKGEGVTSIASPKVLVSLGSSFKIEIASEQDIEYFERRPDGLFELKRLDEKTGLFLSAAVESPGPGEPEGSGRILLRDFTIRLRSIEKREPIEGLSLDVGRPIVNMRESKSTLHLKRGGNYGMVLGPRRYGYLLVHLKVGDGKMEQTGGVLPPSERGRR